MLGYLPFHLSGPDIGAKINVSANTVKIAPKIDLSQAGCHLAVAKLWR